MILAHRSRMFGVERVLNEMALLKKVELRRAGRVTSMATSFPTSVLSELSQQYRSRTIATLSVVPTEK